MDANRLDELKFLLKLQECRKQRSYLSSPSFKNFKAKDKICQHLGEDGLVDFSREITAVKITPAGQALLKFAIDQLPISEKELKVLHKIAAARRLSPAQVTLSTLKATERNAILQSFLERGLISTETRLKRQKAEVWLTQRGQDCLAQMMQHFQELRQVPPSHSAGQPTDEAVLQTIQELDHEEGTNNYLPIFYLRQKLQPPLAREDLDQILYRLQRSDRIELRAIVHTQDYTSEQISAGIHQRAGSPLFFIKVI